MCYSKPGDVAAYRQQAPDNIERIEGAKYYAPTLRARPVLTPRRV